MKLATEEFNDWKGRYLQLEEERKKLVKNVFRLLSNQDLLDELKRRKVIIRDWSANGNKYQIKSCQRCELCEVHKE